MARRNQNWCSGVGQVVRNLAVVRVPEQKSWANVEVAGRLIYDG
jgi:hypothetical protein